MTPLFFDPPYTAMVDEPPAPPPLKLVPAREFSADQRLRLEALNYAINVTPSTTSDASAILRQARDFYAFLTAKD